MKRLLLLFLFVSQICSAQWAPMSDSAFSELGADFTVIRSSPKGEPYVIFRDIKNYSKATVMKFTGSSWIQVGVRGFSAGDAYNPILEFDRAGTPYAAYTDVAKNDKITVMKFDGTNWIPVGSPAFTPSNGTWISFALDKNDVPYVAFRDFQYNYKASVMKFDGTNWTYVGNPGFSLMGTGVQGVGYCSLKINQNNQPIVAFSDLSDDFKASVMEFDGSNWNYVGSHSFSAWQANWTSLVLDSHDVPYVAYWDRGNDGKATVMKFDGTNWVPVVSSGITPGVAEFPSLTIDKHDNLYLAYSDYANGQKASVMKYDGNSWTNIGTGLSTAGVLYTSINVDNNSDVYVAFQDLTDYYGGWQFPHHRGRGVMLKSPQSTPNEILNESDFDIYPNPGSTFSINYTGKSHPVSIVVKNQLGQLIMSKNYGTQDHLKETLNLTSYGKGIYFVEFTSGKSKEVRKIVVE